MPSYRDEAPNIPHRTLWAIGLLVVALLLTLQATGAHQERMDRERNAVVAANVDTLASVVERVFRQSGEYPMSFCADEDSVLLPQERPLLNAFTNKRTEPSLRVAEPGGIVYTPLYAAVADSAASPSGCVIQGYGAHGILLKEVVLRRGEVPNGFEQHSSSTETGS